MSSSSTSAFSINGRYLTQEVTGVQRYARNVVRELADAQNVEFDVLAPRKTREPSNAATRIVRIGRLSGHPWEQLELPLACRGPLLNLCNTAPLIKQDQVLCIHDASVFNAPESYRPAFRTAYRWVQPAIAKRVAAITTVSEYSAQQISQHLGIPLGAIEVLPNGHEHALGWNPERAVKGRAALDQLGEGQPFVLALGSKARHKNLQLIGQLAPHLAALGVGVVVAGGDGRGSAIYDGLADSAVIKTGYVSDNDIAFLMQRALCLLFPSLTEGFGLPIVEAMAWGCPVISSDRASMPEVCGDAALMAPPDQPEKWLEQIGRLLNSSELRNDLIGRAGEVLSRFSWRATADGYRNLMDSAVGSGIHDVRASQTPKVAVAIATIGRPEVVSATLRRLLDRQTLKPHQVIVSCVDLEDAGDLVDDDRVQIVRGRKGLPAQRNAALNALAPDIDIVAFFDDDFVADDDWLKVAVAALQADPEICAITGNVLADDIKGPGLSFEEALEILARERPAPRWERKIPYSPYGCNMAFPVSAIGDHRFDERLVLYGWLEDRDFAAALARKGGKLVKISNAYGVHMGTKVGRIAGDRLGYSQVVNPIYMLRKGTMTLGQVADHMFRNLTSNTVLSIRPEPYVDRVGRLRGNLRGLADVARGRLTPERAAEFGSSRKFTPERAGPDHSDRSHNSPTNSS